MNIFFVVLYQPLFNLLVWLYNVIPGNDIGLAIIALTLLIRLVLYPVTQQSLKSQKAMQTLQPKINALKEQYKDDKDAQAKAMMALYKDEKVNPLSSCLPLVIQLVVLITLYRVLSAGITSAGLDGLYPFVHDPGHLNTSLLGFVDLGAPNIVLAIIAGIVQFFQARMMITRLPGKSTVTKSEGAKDEAMLASVNKSMLYMMPLMTVLIGARLPGGLALYWVVSNAFMVIQQTIAFRTKKPKTTTPTIEPTKT